MTTTLVTGGASGIGHAIAKELKNEGHDVITIDINPKIDDSADLHIVADPSSDEGIERIVESLSDREVNNLVHCAAIGQSSSLLETSRSGWQNIIRTNLEGTIAITQTVIPHMPKGSRIVLFSSGTVFRSFPNMSAYVASKAGVIGFARSLADELGGDEITVNVVSPGITATPMIAQVAHLEPAIIAGRAIKRRSHPQDLVDPVKFLLSPGAGFVTGQTLCVDGGAVKH